MVTGMYRPILGSAWHTNLQAQHDTHVVKIMFVYVRRMNVANTDQTLYEQTVVLFDIVNTDRLLNQQLPNDRRQWQCYRFLRSERHA